MKKRDQRQKRRKRKQKPRFVDRGESFVIDFYPQGKSLSRRSSEDYNPQAVVVTVDGFQFFDVILIVGSKLSTKDSLLLNTKNRNILRLNQNRYSQLSNSALEVLPSIINRIVVTFESRYVSFLNHAHPLTTQMHQLQLLPGIGQKRMWSIIEARKKAPFTSFTDFTRRTGISDPMSLFSSRILIELGSSPKYSLFTKKIQSYD